MILDGIIDPKNDESTIDNEYGFKNIKRTPQEVRISVNTGKMIQIIVWH